MCLEAKRITFGYKKGVNIINDVTFTVNKGERVGIVAPSGFGKTTLCRILAGYIKPHGGQALFNEKNVYDIKGYHPVQMIWQHPENAVNPRLKMKDTLAEGDRIEERVMSGLGIERDWLERFPGELSGGEMQRFCVARALGKSTQFLIADEISAMLDMITQAQLWNFLLAEVEARKLGLIVVTHNMHLVNQICTRIEDMAHV